MQLLEQLRTGETITENLTDSQKLELAVHFQPQLIIPQTDTDDNGNNLELSNVVYKVQQDGENLWITYVYNWNFSNVPSWNVLGEDHAWDHEPVIARISLESPNDRAEYLYDNFHYQAGRTTEPILRVEEGYHGFTPHDASGFGDAAVYKAGLPPEVPHTVVQSASIFQPLDDETFQLMEDRVSQLPPALPGVSSPLSLYDAFYAPALVGERGAFSRTLEEEKHSNDSSNMSERLDTNESNEVIEGAESASSENAVDFEFNIGLPQIDWHEVGGIDDDSSEDNLHPPADMQHDLGIEAEEMNNDAEHLPRLEWVQEQPLDKDSENQLPNEVIDGLVDIELPDIPWEHEQERHFNMSENEVLLSNVLDTEQVVEPNAENPHPVEVESGQYFVRESDYASGKIEHTLDEPPILDEGIEQ